jgi:NADPH:quinone reductase-like Zn-dependent oxidoreductase
MATGRQHPQPNEQQQMDALVIEASGPPARALAVRCKPVPEPSPAEVFVEAHASAVNPLGLVNAAGLLGMPLPMTPGVDFAGVVVSDGDLIGQEGSAPQLGMKRPGTHARLVALPQTWLSRKPARLTMTEAGTVGRPYLEAWRTMIEAGELTPGETTVIPGGAGLVGQAASAIASGLGEGGTFRWTT